MSQQREYGSEKTAEPLIVWLNSAFKTKSARKSYVRVSSLASSLSRLEVLSNKYEPAYRDSSLTKQRTYQSIWAVAQNTQEEINSILSRYRLQPQIGEARLGARRWFLHWKSGAKGMFTAKIRNPLVPIDWPISEPDAVMQCLDLSQAGFLSRVRQCLNCSTWYYARFSHSKFCTTQCQQTHFRNNPEFKEHRRRYQREYRVLKASGKVK